MVRYLAMLTTVHNTVLWSCLNILVFAFLVSLNLSLFLLCFSIAYCKFFVSKFIMMFLILLLFYLRLKWKYIMVILNVQSNLPSLYSRYTIFCFSFYLCDELKQVIIFILSLQVSTFIRWIANKKKKQPNVRGAVLSLYKRNR